LVRAGYINSGDTTKQINHSLTGIPQGSVLGPILSNIYLHELDCFMETIQKQYTQKGRISKVSAKYIELQKKMKQSKKAFRISKRRSARDKSNLIFKKEMRDLEKVFKSNLLKLRAVPYGYKTLVRVYYVRYADD